MFRRQLKDENFNALLKALHDYAADGCGYSFVSDGDDKKLAIHILLDDPEAFVPKHVAALGWAISQHDLEHP